MQKFKLSHNLHKIRLRSPQLPILSPGYQSSGLKTTSHVLLQPDHAQALQFEHLEPLSLIKEQETTSLNRSLFIDIE
jgi:hypothetical protein